MSKDFTLPAILMTHVIVKAYCALSDGQTNACKTPTYYQVKVCIRALRKASPVNSTMQQYHHSHTKTAAGHGPGPSTHTSPSFQTQTF